jgi:hypothetical protein
MAHQSRSDSTNLKNKENNENQNVEACTTSSVIATLLQPGAIHK